MKKRSLKRSMKAACAVAAVATCWGVGQQAQANVTVSTTPATVTLNSSTDVSSVWLVYGTSSSGSPLTVNFVPFDNPVTAGVSAVQNVTLDLAPSDVSGPYAEFEYTILGVYSDPSNPDVNERSGVSVTLTDSAATYASGQSFDSYFDTSHANESQLITALQTSDTSTLANFFTDNFLFDRLPFGVPGTQMDFTLGNVSGTGSLTAVPEPASMMLIAVGSSLLLVQRRRRQLA